MPAGIGPRFAAPPPALPGVRFRAPGLGGQPERLPASTDDPTIHDLETTTPRDGFTGIGSRTRFTAVPRMVPIGHGGAQQGVSATPAVPDPASGRTQFSKDPYGTGVATFEPNVRTSALDRLSEMVEASGFLRYFRNRIDTTVPGTKLQDPNVMGWGNAPYPRAWRQPRYTLRPEFEQGAQNFLGLHTLLTKGARMSTSPARMGAPRTNRLTMRAAPGSFGQKAKVMNRA